MQVVEGLDLLQDTGARSLDSEPPAPRVTSMRAPDEAIRGILDPIRSVEETQALRLADAVGRVLALPAVADIDLPPFAKSAMDGYAVHAVDLSEARAPEGERRLHVVGESRAGAPFTGVVPEGACAAIYTGAEVPAGCDAVVIVEKSRQEGAEVVLADRPEPLQNICKQGQDVRAGARVLEPGRRLRACDLPALASIGCDPVSVLRRPRVCVMTSGDELVRPDQRPGRGEIRESNTLLLAALARAAGAEVDDRGVVRDDPELIEAAVREALGACDLLITTGGVSMGRHDHVGAALAAAGVEPVFHKVAIQPGKPLWYGLWRAGRGGEQRPVPVFGLPGNPVSCLVNHAVFVRPALERLGGVRAPATTPTRGRWGGPERPPNPRERHVPVRRVGRELEVVLEPVPWNGSADVIGLLAADAFAVLPREARVAPGDPVAFWDLA
jgi:molybdopterin molybdotransferase